MKSRWPRIVNFIGAMKLTMPAIEKQRRAGPRRNGIAGASLPSQSPGWGLPGRAETNGRWDASDSMRCSATDRIEWAANSRETPLRRREHRCNRRSFQWVKRRRAY
jgi:hypothetical protein